MNKILVWFLLIVLASCREKLKTVQSDKKTPDQNITYIPNEIKDSLSHDSFSKELQILNEPSLLEKEVTGNTIYRCTRISSVMGPSTIRVEKVNDSVYYFYHKIAERRVKSLKKVEYEL